MPPTLIPAPSFAPAQQDQDFEDDFDLPEGDTVIPPTALPPITVEDDDAEEDWDSEFAPRPAAAASGPSTASSSSGRGTVTNLGAAKLGGRRTGQPLPEEWDDDEDFDLPPPSSKPLKLSLSPRTKIRLDNEAGRPSFAGSLKLNPPGSVTTVDDEDDEDAWNASTIKVSKLELTAAMAQSSKPATGTPKASTSSAPSADMDEDFEDDLVIPDNVATLALKPANLAHRVSKISLDGWGDSTTSTLFSDGSSGTLSQPSPSATASQPSTEDESDDFGDEEGEFDGLVLPDSMSSKEMQKMLEDKKKGLGFEAKDAVRVARPSDGEDDFEMGLVIGNDEELSPSRLRSQPLPSRAVGRGAVRSISEPQRSASASSSTSFPLSQSDRIVRPPSRLREEITNSGSDRESTTSPTLVIPPRHPTARATTESFPSLRRTPSSIIPSRQPATRWQTLSNTIRPSPSLLLPKSTSISQPPRPPSPTKTSTPIPNSPSPSPYPRSPSPVSSTASTTRFMSGNGPLSPGGASSSRAGLKGQKSFTKLPGVSAPTASSANKQRLPRKASMGALADTRGPGQPSSLVPSISPSPSPEVPFPSTRPGLRRTGGGLNHAASYRDLAGGTATVGPSSSTPIERKKFSYEAPTVAYRAKRAENLGRRSAASDMSGSDRERERPPIASSSRVVSRSRPSISSVFPGATLSAASSPASATDPNTARSPSPRSAAPMKKPSYSSLHQRSVTMPSAPPPAVRVLRRPKKSRVFGDGSELDGIEDLAVEREKESKYRVAPTGRGNVGQGKSAKQPATSSSSSTTVGPNGTIGRRRGLVEVGLRAGSSVSSQGNHEPPPKAAPGLRRQQRLDLSKPDALATPPARKTRDGSKSSAKKKPTLIRNLGGAGSPKVVGDMKWNPKSLKWEGNDSILKEFETSSSARPALITHLTGSSVGGLTSPSGTFSGLMSGARVVGEMMFDPIRMCWISTKGEEDDPFASMDEMGDDEDDWDADGKGGTIRALVTTGSGPGSTTATSSVRRDSGLSSEEGSPARSHRGSHGRSASESDNESITGASANGGRNSSLGGPMLTIDEHEDGTIPVPRDLVAACAAAEDRHRSEMRGWHAAPPTIARRRVSVRSAPPVAQESEDPDRSYLWDIRALATRT
ncbi:hypothetical protein M407DRAFT_32491 [Tulasnella calospora MUT 4182]|uniref:Uncharacterized protein n=1 Tax=Tulasnella calospora MUT 4182 TaxID=1051891 RepID=A0A0C3Q3W2_9AGAM|nr:hypothetical protein M407DRAFT_32491 [Tulasnella calospora MUT 4182]